jgi:hypothetical protein
MKLLSDSFDKNNRRHISQLHHILEVLGEKVPLDSDDATERRFGVKTLAALTRVKKKLNLPQAGELNKKTLQALNQKAIEKFYASRTQTAILHRKLVRIGRIAKLEYDLSGDMKARKQGVQTGSALKAFQNKYGLAETGRLNKETLERIESVVASRVAPFKKLKVPRTVRLMKVRNPLRLNMQKSKVADLQRALAWMGHEIDVKEARTQIYGKTTRKAVIAFQTAQNLPVSGNVGWKTAQKINSLIQENSMMVSCKDKFRIRGSVRNDLWEGVKLAAIQVYEKKLRGEALLGERKTLANGFYDLQYLPPLNPLTGKPKDNFQLLIKMLDPQGKLLQEKTFQVTGKVLWVNFTDGDDRYRGESDFQALEKALNKALGPHAAIGEIEESARHQDVAYLRKETFLAAEDIMKMTLAFRTAAAVNSPALTPEVFYAFIRQNHPQSLPGDLLPDSPQEWSAWISTLVQRCAEGIAFLSKDLQEDILKGALKQNYVSRKIANELPQILAALSQLKTAHVLKKPVFGGDGSLQTLLSASTIDAQAHAAVAASLGETNGFNQGFWQSLAGLPGVGSAAADDFRATADLGYMTSNFGSLLAFLKNKIGSGKSAAIKRSSDFARLSESEWVNLIDQNGGQIPSWVKGKNASQKKRAYAASLKEKAEHLFPAVSLIAEVDRSKKHALGNVGNILAAIEAKPNFDLRKDNIENLFAAGDAALSSHEMAALKALQRIHRITPGAGTGVALLEAGYYSAAQICREGRDVFTGVLGNMNISGKVASAIYENCATQHATAIAALGEFRFDLQRFNPDCVTSLTCSAIEELKKDIPDIESLFGPVDVREVRHCESVLGPSAYLTDLFRFLWKKISKVAGKRVLDILFRRRPDLGNIKLNCRNTDTALPYVDLVCEILENRVLDGNGALNFQSTWPAEDLLAEPEHVEAGAYEKLKTADYPLHSHFNLWQEETRALLAHLGIPRYQLMDAFLIDANPALAENNHCNSAAEYFGVSDQEQQIILTPRPSIQWQKKYWSNDAVGGEASVCVFLQKSGLNYRQLFDVLQCEFVNGSDPKSFILCPLDNCDLDLQRVKNLSVQRLDKMNRFLRLWKKTGLELWEFDLLLMAPSIGDGSLNQTFLIRLRQFEELRKALKLGVEACAALFGPLNTRTRNAPSAAGKQPKNIFENLFLSGSMEPQTYADFAVLLTAAATSKSLEDYRAHVLSALSLNNDEFNLLLPLTSAMLTRDSLGCLFRYKTLSGKLQLKLDDFLLFCRLAGVTDPFASLDSVKRIVEKRQLIREAGATLAQLEYMLEYDPDSSVGWREEMYVQKVQCLREALAGLRDKITAAEDAGDDSLAMLLGLLAPFADAARLQTMLDIIAGAWSASEAEITGFITDHLGPFVADATHAVNVLKDTGPLSPAQLLERRSYVMTELLNYLNATATKECVAAALGMDSSQASLLLNGLHLPGSSRYLLTVLQDEKLHARDGKNGYLYEISSANLPDVFAAFQLLHKASLAVRCLKCTADELTWLSAHPAVGGTLDFNLLPISDSQGAVALDGWLNLWRFLKFKRLFQEPEKASFWTVLEIAANPAESAQSVNEELCKLTGWDPAAHQALHYEQLDYRSPRTYEWFLECHRQSKITGVDFGLLFGWSRRDLALQDQANAVGVRDMVKAKYGREQWLKIFKPIMDELRERKRQALTAYLVERSQREQSPDLAIGGKKVRNPEYWVSSDDLYGWFLIDVEMCSDQLTSRILQAILSTQLYVQRCFLNLENREVETALPDPDIENSWEQWKWMKSYRIWEANRKVFLFPENWIEPELRDTKSPFFEELESDILSREATNDNVEAALQRYIQKLEEVSRLDVCSSFHEKDGPTDLLHVVARTRSVPAIFYYRTYDLIYSRWSPWEKIETDIQSDHVVPWVYNRKLHLFWLTIQEKPIKLKKLPPVKASDTPSETPDPAMFLEIELAWSVRQHEGWDARKTGKKRLIHPWQRPLFSYNLKPRYKADRNCLYIDLYISTSREFNEGVFYDQFKHSKVRLTKVHYDETLRPWHSSSFVFDGNVREVLLRGIPGYYFSPEAGDIRNIDSYQYVKENFNDGADIAPLGIISEQLALPSGMHYRYTRLANNRHRSINPSKFNVFGPDKKTKTLLNNAGDPFEAVLCQQGLAPVDEKIRPVLYQDNAHSFFITQNRQERFWFFPWSVGKSYGVYPFYHPFAEVFQQEINRGGVDTFYRRNLQINPQAFSGRTPFSIAAYSPIFDMDISAAEKEQLDFSRSGAYSIYNWELFFHVPFMMACRLSQNQRFEEAMRWFHYIFDPTNTQMLPTPQRFWVTKPFYETSDAEYRKQRIKNIIENIDDFKAQLVEWKNHPFRPHLIAEHRTVAYQRTVVMKYLDNMIAWGDQLFRQGTMESINEATLLYILAHELLGRRPVLVPALNREEKTFNELVAESTLDDFGNAKVEVALENTLGLPIQYAEPVISADEEAPSLEISYYGLPHNDKLLQYWDTVADRLFKIRHGLNYQGLKRSLPLFEPPIDPALLVKAAAAGLDLAAVLNDMNAPEQAYRFEILAAKAIDFCRDVKNLGDQLLKALERRDAEELAVLHASNELTLIHRMLAIKKFQVEEFQYALESIERRREACQIKIDHIKSLSEPLEAEEKAGDWSTAADVFKVLSKVSSVGAMIASLFPDVKTGANGVGGSPEATVKIGGSNVRKGFEYAGKACDAAAELCKWRQDSLKSEAASERTKAERAAAIAQEEKAIADLDQQKLAKEILQKIAELDLENFEKEMELRHVEHEYLRDKYTNHQLYQWMLTQIATVYFQAYQLAYDMAKRAEKSYRRELGLTDSNFIQFGYWDSLKKGLLSADRLIYDIRRMEATYLDQHRRELEITKHVSLARLAPDKLLELTATGRCTFDLQEWMYNLDYPGHYRRRIKSVSVSIPCEADEFTNINCGLTLNASEVRISNVVGSGYAKEAEDIRFIAQPAAGESIATSHGEYDNGLFALKFDDERFLPFEGAGAISSWDIHMPPEHNQFDFSTMTDFIMHLSYTAQEGGEQLGTAAKAQLDEILPSSGMMLVGLKYGFPAAWEAFLHPSPAGAEQTLSFTLSKEHYPFLARSSSMTLTKTGLVVSGSYGGNYIARIVIPGQGATDCLLTKDAGLNNMHHKPDVFEGSTPATGTFSIMVRRDTSGSGDFSSLSPDELNDIILILHYEK